MDDKTSIDNLSTDQMLTLMGTYLDEWKFRDELLWKQVYRFFYATLIVMLLPNIAGFVGIDLPDFPHVLFPIVAAVMALFFFYTSMGYIKRMEASNKTYSAMIAKLPPEYQRISIKSEQVKHGHLFMRGMASTICTLMFAALIVISIVMIVYYL